MVHWKESCVLSQQIPWYILCLTSMIDSHLIIPNLDSFIIRSRENVGLITRGIIIDTVHTTLMSLQRIMRHRRSQSPHLNGTVQTRTGEGIRVLRVELDHHDIMLMALKVLRAVKVLIPIPEFDGHIIRATEHVGEGGVDLDEAHVVGVGLEFLHLLHGVVIVDAEFHVVGGGDEPLLASDEFGAADGEVGELEGFGAGSGLVVPDHDLAGVERGEGPWFRWVDVDRFHPVGCCRQLFVDVHAERLFVCGLFWWVDGWMDGWIVLYVCVCVMGESESFVH